MDPGDFRGINASFLAARLIDEISLTLVPVADGDPDSPTIFEGNRAKAHALDLVSCNRIEGGILHLRYRRTQDQP